MDQENPHSPPTTEPGVADKDARQWGMFCHLGALAGYIIPFGNIIGPLIIWSMKKADYPFVDEQGKEALNFQICLTIYILVAIPTFCIGVGFVLVPALGIAGLILMIIAGIKANNGESYRYPLTIRFLK